ncbi:MAG: ABC transporter ATP-binding protein [Peptoniphilaceae bacterium]|nr:ABC transporter ATP-binding protein [Peptoniphilaceae bacterium]MDY5765645.1 ABC transporter ATP-binding protein [Peptoniphilaceae bacterium]
MGLIFVDHLTIGYEKHPVQEDISFTVQDGDYVAIVGENGSGKTTLMRTLLGLQPALGGEIRFGDGLSSRQIGYLPQQTPIQRDFPASVREIVLSGFQGKMGFRPFYTRRQKQFAEQTIDRLQLRPLVNRCYRELSGGQQQRVLLARALCAAEKVLLLDEPVSGLDPHVTAEMYATIQKLNQEGMTILMISHDMESVLRYATHIIHVGHTVTFGTKDEYLERYGLEHAYHEDCMPHDPFKEEARHA